jgi:hypothetical protein
MSIQIVNNDVSVPIPSNTSIQPKSTIVPIQPISQSVTAVSKFGKLDDTSALTAKQLKEIKESNQAVRQIPISVQNMELMKTTLDEIDIRDPDTYQIITPTNVLNYLDSVYGNVDMELLEPDALTISEPVRVDISSLPMDLSKNSSIDFIALDSSMAFLTSNGTSAENLVIAENMAKEQTGFPVLISLNGDSKQNLDIIHSSDVQPISIPLDIPVNSSSVEVSDILTGIISNTQTLQIISPDFVTQPLSDESAHLYEFSFTFFGNLFKGFEKMGKKDVSIGYEKIFGAHPGERVLALLKNPASVDPSFLSSLPLNQLPVLHGGLFQLVLHGAVLSEDFEYVDCTDFEHLSFVGPFGFSVLASDKFIDGSIREPVKLQTFVRGQVASKNVCRIPKIRFTPDFSIDGSSDPFKLIHTNDKKNTITLLDNNDLIKLFGTEPVSPHVVLNLVRFFGSLRSNGPQRLDIVSCLDVPEVYRSVGYKNFALGKSPSGIPTKFQYKAELEIVDADIFQADIVQKMEKEKAVQFHKDNVARIEANINNMHGVFFQPNLHAANRKALPGAVKDLEKAQAALKAHLPVANDGRFRVKMSEGIAKDAVCRLSAPSTFDPDKEQRELDEHIARFVKGVAVEYENGRKEIWNPTPYEVEAALRITRNENFELSTLDWVRATRDYLQKSKREGFKIVMPDIPVKSPRPTPQEEAQQRARECSALIERDAQQMISVNPNEGAIGYQIEKYLQDPLLIKNIIVTFKLEDGTLLKMSGLDYKYLQSKIKQESQSWMHHFKELIRGNGFSQESDFSDFLPELVETFRQYRENFPDNSEIVLGGTFKKIFNELPRIKAQREQKQAREKAAADEAAAKEFAKKAAEREEQARNPLPIGWRAEKQKDGKILYIHEVQRLQTYERPS